MQKLANYCGRKSQPAFWYSSAATSKSGLHLRNPVFILQTQTQPFQKLPLMGKVTNIAFGWTMAWNLQKFTFFPLVVCFLGPQPLFSLPFRHSYCRIMRLDGFKLAYQEVTLNNLHTFFTNRNCWVIVVLNKTQCEPPKRFLLFKSILV